MTRDEVLKIAISVGAATHAALFGRTDYVVMTQYELKRFANLVAQHEREACLTEIETGIWFDKTADEILYDIAQAIRSRGENK